MKKVLVAGGAGFLGSHLCDYLLEKNYYVICIDNLITGSIKNIKHLLRRNDFKFFQDDVIKLKVPSLEKVDYIFHLASPASPVDYQNYPEETALVNTLGTLNLLKLAVANKAKFLLASTSEVYGDPKEHPQKESYWGNVNSFGPRSCYDESKRFGETLTYIYLRKHKLNTRIIRIFNTYGPRMKADDGRIISNFVNQALRGSPLTVYGDGSATRSFCYCSDLVEGIFKAMFMPKTAGEIINLGNPEEKRVIDMAKLIKTGTNSKSKIVYKPLPEDDPKKRKPDISKALKLLKWKPNTPLKIGLQKTIEYYQSPD